MSSVQGTRRFVEYSLGLFKCVDRCGWGRASTAVEWVAPVSPADGLWPRLSPSLSPAWQVSPCRGLHEKSHCALCLWTHQTRYLVQKRSSHSQNSMWPNLRRKTREETKTGYYCRLLYSMDYNVCLQCEIKACSLEFRLDLVWCLLNTRNGKRIWPILNS